MSAPPPAATPEKPAPPAPGGAPGAGVPGGQPDASRSPKEDGAPEDSIRESDAPDLERYGRLREDEEEEDQVGSGCIARKPLFWIIVLTIVVFIGVGMVLLLFYGADSDESPPHSSSSNATTPNATSATTTSDNGTISPDSTESTGP